MFFNTCFWGGNVLLTFTIEKIIFLSSTIVKILRRKFIQNFVGSRGKFLFTSIFNAGGADIFVSSRLHS